VDDHQTTNAQFLVAQGGGWLLPQATLTPQSLAELLAGLTREELVKRAVQAKALEKLGATEAVVMACEELTR
jgi:UDP-N-acetylglucosamine--N-acetylmuramyl-(pentapeptide) pyrophosphoryl-undecaprenol N-acetylglucosamine transferase